MPLKEPESMDECIYFTLRDLPNKGHVKAWVLKERCSKCNKGLIGKPRDPKTGKIKIRATEYQCPECSHKEDKNVYDETLTASIKYKCPYCNHEDETKIPFKRKKLQVLDEKGKKTTVETLRFNCNKCQKPIDITKKMK